ncbi:RNA polymerase sigma factor [Paludisphaera mucosa]|uniref:Sigma-70 family RNA polymerase sigma factor n=1 Tax=Paludisphaera mucosa TaxID=3030827 RepID=A0ABT6FBS8_9BACT|nr:sigma-70 family RNA polymerase sigma factor [Paludisphaera mucosa]MDG3005049.1 sigma-70 family RNA polymerase sigma factor [Paludisphaera mucosa]
MGVGPDDLGRLFDAHAAALILYARQWREGPEAEDLVQDAFVALARRPTLPDQPAAWLHRVVRNAALSARRGSRRRKAREASVGRPEGDAWFAAVDDRLDAREAAAHLAGLDPEAREVVTARIWGGLTFEQVAELQGCSTAAAHRRYKLGLARLLERLERPCPSTNPTP